MILNLLFTALCLAITFVVTADIRAPRVERVKVRRDNEPGRRRHHRPDHHGDRHSGAHGLRLAQR